MRCFLSCNQCSHVNISVSVHCRLNTDSPSVGSIDNQTYGHVDVTEKNTTGNAELMFSDEIQRCVLETVNDVFCEYNSLSLNPCNFHAIPGPCILKHVYFYGMM